MSGKRRRITVVAVFLVIFVFLSLPIGVSRSAKEAITNFFYPLFSLARSVGEKLGHIWDAAFHSDNIVRQNLQKEREILKLRTELALAREEIRELSSLNEQLAKLARYDFEIIAARVIGREPDSWYKTLLIDRGVKHGVGRGMPVVYGENLVGRVTEAGGRWSRVRLVLDPQSAVPALTRGGLAAGLIVGAGPAQLKMTYIEHNARIEVGDTVVTAHLAQVLGHDESPLPRGLVIGKIVSVSKEEQGLYQSANLKSEVDFRNLPEVFVVVPK